MKKKKKSNILFITSDQQHWSTLGCMNPEIQTPNLDRLAAQGTVFDRAYTVNPTCTPTRASMITGQYPSQHGAYSLGTKLPENVPTLGDELQKAGYKTSLIGKAHFQQIMDHPHYRSIESNPVQQNLDFWRKFNGPFYGFDHVELARNHTDEGIVGQHYAIWMEENGFHDWRKCFSRPAGTSDPQSLTWNIPEEYHYDAWIASRVNEKIDEHCENDENFFIWASFPDPHPPYLVPEPWDTLYDPNKINIYEKHPGEDFSKMPKHFELTQQENPDFSPWQEPEGNANHGFASHLHDKDLFRKRMAVYYAMVTLMDKYIGKILDKLEEQGVLEDTLIVYTTDHGHLLGQHGLIYKGAFHYEDLLKVPFIVSQPGTVPSNEVNHSLQSIVDLAPTFLSHLGLSIPRCMTGKDQSSVWYGEKVFLRENVIVENRHQPFKLNLKTFIDERYKLTIYYGETIGELFDLENDPSEIYNLWDEPKFQKIKKELLLKFLQAEMEKEPILMPRVCSA